jgi:hypothetical protein
MNADDQLSPPNWPLFVGGFAVLMTLLLMAAYAGAMSGAIEIYTGRDRSSVSAGCEQICNTRNNDIHKRPVARQHSKRTSGALSLTQQTAYGMVGFQRAPRSSGLVVRHKSNTTPKSATVSKRLRDSLS